jgi:hypothetical protein
MITVTPAVSVSTKDSALSPFPSEPMLGGQPVACAKGGMGQDVALAAGSSGVSLPFPVGVTTAAIVAIVASGAADLIVNYKGQPHVVPLGQAWFGYTVLASDLTVSTVLGGSIQYVVGG